MNRRDVLTSLGAMAGVGSVAGCLAEEQVDCEPRENDVSLGTIDRTADSAVTFRGAVVGLSDTVLVEDSTGRVAVQSTDEQYIQQDNLEIGTCLGGTGVPTPEASWANRMPVLTVTGLRSFGEARRSVTRIQDPPNVSFEVTKNSDETECGAVIQLRHTGGESVRAENLLVARRNTDASVTDEQTAEWFNLAESTKPWEVVEEGDSVTFPQSGGSVGTLAWVDTWSTQLAGWETEKC